MSVSSAGVAVGVPSIGLVRRFAVAVTSLDPRRVTWVLFWANVLVSSVAFAAFRLRCFPRRSIYRYLRWWWWWSYAVWSLGSHYRASPHSPFARYVVIPWQSLSFSVDHWLVRPRWWWWWGSNKCRIWWGWWWILLLTFRSQMVCVALVAFVEAVFQFSDVFLSFDVGHRVVIARFPTAGVA